jgi:ABC-type multidrug transport system fused ATPase/permease subunit
MEDGLLAEYDTPAALLAKKDGHLRQLVDALGEDAAAELVAKASKG